MNRYETLKNGVNNNITRRINANIEGTDLALGGIEHFFPIGFFGQNTWS